MAVNPMSHRGCCYNQVRRWLLTVKKFINCKTSCRCPFSSLYDVHYSREIIIISHRFIPRLHRYILNSAFENKATLIFVTVALLGAQKQWKNLSETFCGQIRKFLWHSLLGITVIASRYCGLQCIPGQDCCMVRVPGQITMLLQWLPTSD